MTDRGDGVTIYLTARASAMRLRGILTLHETLLALIRDRYLVPLLNTATGYNIEMKVERPKETDHRLRGQRVVGFSWHGSPTGSSFFEDVCTDPELFMRGISAELSPWCDAGGAIERSESCNRDVAETVVRRTWRKRLSLPRE
jgi:hypothetical protein